MSSLTALSTLIIGDNQLAGDLAAAMANLPVGMYVLGLDNNDFYGTVPPEGLTFTNLYFFSAQGNLLSGDLSIAIGNLPTGLNEISLGWNDFTGRSTSNLKFHQFGHTWSGWKRVGWGHSCCCK